MSALAFQASSAEPEWLALLRAEAERTSKAAVAARLGYSRTAVSLLLAGKYPGATDKLQAAVMATLAHRVPCPGMGEEIPVEDCREWAARPFAATNSLRVRMHAACRACPLRPRPEGGSDAQ